MSHYLVELYTPNAAWAALPAQAREQFLGQIQTGMGALAELGIELLSLAPTDTGIDYASAHRFLGIWRFPDSQARDALLQGIKASGWYAYFDHINASSKVGDFASHLGHLAELGNA